MILSVALRPTGPLADPSIRRPTGQPRVHASDCPTVPVTRCGLPLKHPHRYFACTAGRSSRVVRLRGPASPNPITGRRGFSCLHLENPISAEPPLAGRLPASPRAAHFLREATYPRAKEKANDFLPSILRFRFSARGRGSMRSEWGRAGELVVSAGSRLPPGETKIGAA